MKDRDHDDLEINDAIEYSVRESLYSSASCFAVYSRIEKRRHCNPLNRFASLDDKIHAQTNGLLFVPNSGRG